MRVTSEHGAVVTNTEQDRQFQSWFKERVDSDEQLHRFIADAVYEHLEQ